MALTGTYERTVDDKGRIAVPKQLREAFTSRTATEKNNTAEQGTIHLFVGPGNDQALVLYAPEDFDKLAQRMDASSSTRADVLKYERFFFHERRKSSWMVRDAFASRNGWRPSPNCNGM